MTSGAVSGSFGCEGIAVAHAWGWHNLDHAPGQVSGSKAGRSTGNFHDANFLERWGRCYNGRMTYRSSVRRFVLVLSAIVMVAAIVGVARGAGAWSAPAAVLAGLVFVGVSVRPRPQ